MVSNGIQAIWQVRESVGFRGVSSEALLHRFLTQREDIAFRELVRRHGKSVYLQCRAILHCEDLAHEAFQESFTALVRKGHTIKHLVSIEAWLVKTARNRSIDLKRRLVVRQKIEQAIGTELAKKVILPTDVIQQAEVYAALAELPEKYRTALTLCIVYGATHTEASKELRWPLGTVDTRVRRGLYLLKKK